MHLVQRFSNSKFLSAVACILLAIEPDCKVKSLACVVELKLGASEGRSHYDFRRTL
jgi:hypothetical protein